MSLLCNFQLSLPPIIRKLKRDATLQLNLLQTSQVGRRGRVFIFFVKNIVVVRPPTTSSVQDKDLFYLRRTFGGGSHVARVSSRNDFVKIDRTRRPVASFACTLQVTTSGVIFTLQRNKEVQKIFYIFASESHSRKAR